MGDPLVFFVGIVANIVCLLFSVYLTVFMPVGRPYNHQFFLLNLVKILIAQIKVDCSDKSSLLR